MNLAGRPDETVKTGQADQPGYPAGGSYMPLLDLVRIVAFCLVVLHHLISVEAKYDPAPILPRALTYGISGVDFFFVLSGYMMGRLFLRPDDARRSSPLRFLIMRASRVYPLYWLISLALVGLYMIAPDMVYSSRSDTPDLVRSFLLWPAANAPLHAVGWTLVHLVYFYLVTAAILALPRRAALPAIGAWVLATAAMHLWLPRGGSPELSLLASPFTFEYAAGAALGLLPSLPRRLARWLGALALATLIAIAVTQALAGQDIRSLDRLSRVLILAPPAAALIYALGSWTMPAPTGAMTGYAAIARAGYALYLSHILTLSVLGRLWGPFAQPGIWDNLIALPLMLVLSVAVAIALERLVETPIARFVRQRTRHIA